MATPPFANSDAVVNNTALRYAQYFALMRIWNVAVVSDYVCVCLVSCAALVVMLQHFSVIAMFTVTFVFSHTHGPRWGSHRGRRQSTSSETLAGAATKKRSAKTHSLPASTARSSRSGCSTTAGATTTGPPLRHPPQTNSWRYFYPSPFVNRETRVKIHADLCDVHTVV